jgi:hypothetical protein
MSEIDQDEISKILGSEIRPAGTARFGGFNALSIARSQQEQSPAPAPHRELLEAAKNGAERLRSNRRDIVADERHLRKVMLEVADALAAAVAKCEGGA